MILGRDQIKLWLNDGQIFRKGTWLESSVKEASYALRVATDWLIIDGNSYDKNEPYPKEKMYQGRYLEIEPGKIAILSTKEELNMPGDLVGRLGIRLDFAAKGLSGLMGFQVDPFYGSDKPDERLFIRVANVGNESVRLREGDPVFNIEFGQVLGDAHPAIDKERTWDRLQKTLESQSQPSWTYVTRVQTDVTSEMTRVQADVTSEIENIRDYLQPVVMFGIFLVAVTILGVVVLLILGAQDTPAGRVPSWVTKWGWMLLLATLSFAGFSTAVMGVVGALVFWNQRRRPNERHRRRQWRLRLPRPWPFR